jgi:c-di-GMP-binding flagellar brake protein YcgR
LLRSLRDSGVPVILNAPDGAAITVALWTVDDGQARLNFSADPTLPQLARVVDADEAVAVAYLESVKLQFDLHGFMLVRGFNTCALQCEMPQAMYRFQRRNAYRVRPRERHQPLASFRHPSLPDMALALRVLDVSIGGCALWLPHDVPPLQAGTLLGEVHVELDADTRIAGQLSLLHVSGPGNGRSSGDGASTGGHGARLGCEWKRLPSGDERLLQRWIDRTQQRRRLLTLG